jgi:hypothetical protein
VITPPVDMGLAVLITFCAVGLWLLRPMAQFGGRFERLRYHIIATYFTISIPVHVATYVTRSTQALEWFPEWYSVLIVFVQLAFMVSLLRVRFDPELPDVARWILRLDGVFLTIAGGTALVAETITHFLSAGPQRDVFGGHSWATVGFFEAHGLAIILGILLIRAAAAPDRGRHLLAASVHLLLGGANLVFWGDTVAPLGMEAMVAPITAAHLLLFVIQASYALPLVSHVPARRLMPTPVTR